MGVELGKSLPEVAHKYVVDSQVITAVGIDPGYELDGNSVTHFLTYIGTIQDVSLWVLGDILLWAERKAANEVNSATGREFWDKRNEYWDEIVARLKHEMSKHTIYNIAATCRTWAWDERRHTENISFEHHRLLNPMDEHEREYWLDMVDAGGWSVSHLRHHIYNPDSDPLADMSARPPKSLLWDDNRIEGAVRELTNGEGLNPPTVIQLMSNMRDEYESRGAYHE